MLEEEGTEGISRTQLYKDLIDLEFSTYKAPIVRVKDGRKIYFKYSDPDYSILKQPLNEEEADQIRSALSVFSRFKGMPQFEWVNEMIPMLESRFGLIERKTEIISYDSNADLKGLHFLTPLFNAIVNERVLLVKYKDFKSPEPYEITFHPCYLKQFNNRWFAFGLNAVYGNPYWNLALDRIENLSETDLKYSTSEIDWEDYFYDIIGVTRPEGGEVQEILLKFTPDIAPYIITKPLHPSQKHNNTTTGLEVRIKVIPNYELERLILSFGEQVAVVSPEDFKKRIAGRISQAYNFYAG